MLVSPFMAGTVAVFAGADRHPQTTISSDFSDGLFGPHSEYSKSPELEAYSMPFNITAWDGTPTVYDPGTPNSGLAVVYQNLASGAETIEKAAESAAAAVVGGVQATASVVGNTAQAAVGAAENAIKQSSNFFGNMF
jgi:hypothetical protein